MKFLAGISCGVLMFSLAGCDNVGTSDSATIRTETEVIDIDTVGAEMNYEVNRKTVEKVDTVGATIEYDVEKTVVKKTVEIDTITEEIDRQARVDMEEGDYKVVDKTVEQETITEEVDVPN